MRGGLLDGCMGCSSACHVQPIILCSVLLFLCLSLNKYPLVSFLSRVFWCSRVVLDRSAKINKVGSSHDDVERIHFITNPSFVLRQHRQRPSTPPSGCLWGKEEESCLLPVVPLSRCPNLCLDLSLDHQPRLMSLQVEGHRRGRSRSPGGRERDRSRSRGPPLVVDVNPEYDDRDRDRDRYYEYEEHRSSYRSPTSPTDDYHRRPRSPAVENGARASSSYGDLRDRNSDSDREREKAKTGLGLMDAFLPQKYAKKLEGSDAYNLMTAPISDRSRERSRDRRAEKKEKLEEDLAYGKLPAPSVKDARPASPSYEYASMPQYPYAHPAAEPRHSPDKLDVVGSARHARGRSRSKSPAPRHRSRDAREKKSQHAHRDSLTADPRASSASVASVAAAAAAAEAGDRSGPRKSAMKRTSSPQPPVNRMSSLSVNTAYNAGSLSAAPPSPLLESYHGTYQSMSPMPSPLLIPTHFGGGGDAHVLDASPLNSDDERGAGAGAGGGEKKRSRRARFTDPEDDAQRLADALRGSKPPRTGPLVEILPGLTHEQVMELRAEYKRLVKTGPERKGVNVAKHVRVRLKDADPSLMKACYATALGRWESEAYWSSFWYQGDKTRRELLIESLMGRTNEEVRRIKDSFSDKTYDDSLARCMRHELKEDKFKKAVLAVLDEQRMEDVDRHGRQLPVDWDLVRDDAYDLHKAVKAEKGGESAMISIVVSRSDNHLREILRAYNEEYGSNFARDALRKSGNLVVRLLADIFSFLFFPSSSFPSSPPPSSLAGFPRYKKKKKDPSAKSLPGRAAGPHPQRRHQQARPRRAARAPRAHGLQEGRPTPRAPDLAAGAVPLGRRPHGGRQEGLPREVRQGHDGGRQGRHVGRVGPVLLRAVHNADAGPGGAVPRVEVRESKRIMCYDGKGPREGEEVYIYDCRGDSEQHDAPNER